MTSDHSNFFGVADSVAKPLFLATYTETMTCVQLLTAPFGLSKALISLVGEERATKDLETSYRSWEDALSRKLYPKSGIAYDQMAASMHQFLEVDRDKEVRTL